MGDDLLIFQGALVVWGIVAVIGLIKKAPAQVQVRKKSREM